jgi:hypothetical protein
LKPRRKKLEAFELQAIQFKSHTNNIMIALVPKRENMPKILVDVAKRGGNVNGQKQVAKLGFHSLLPLSLSIEI